MRIELTIDADGLNVMPEYCTIRPIEAPIDNIAHDAMRWRYVGMSLEEITEKFGKEAAQHVYAMAAQIGVDLTKPPKIEPTIRTETTCTIQAEADKGKWKIYLLPSKYAAWADKRLMLSGSYADNGDDHLLMAALKIYIGQSIERLRKGAK